MKALEDGKQFDDINVTPMLDLAWNLLIIFIVAATASVQGISVNLPKASAAVSQSKPKTKAITITGQGQVYLDTFPVTMPELEGRLRQLKSSDPNYPIVVKGDEQIAYRTVMEVLDLLQRVGITQVGLATKKLVK